MSEDNCIKFAQNVKRYRELKKYSKGRMSELVGCDVSYIGKIERSEKYPNLKMIFKNQPMKKVQSKQVLTVFM